MQKKHAETSTHPELSLRDLRERCYHSLKEARLLLVPPADWRSLRGWIAELGITTYKSPVRGHTFLISHHDLVAIAALVGRSLRVEQPFPAEPRELPLGGEEDASAELDGKETRQKIEALKRQHRREIADLQARYSHEVEALRRRLLTLQRWAESVGLPPASSLAKQPLAGRSSLSDLEGYHLPMLPGADGKRKPHKVPLDLPAGTVSMRTFAQAHGTTRERMTAAIRRREDGKPDGLDAIRRSYGGDSHRDHYFFTPVQQDQAVAYLLRAHAPVALCPGCPHEKETISEKLTPVQDLSR